MVLKFNQLSILFHTISLSFLPSPISAAYKQHKVFLLKVSGVLASLLKKNANMPFFFLYDKAYFHARTRYQQ